MIRPLRRAHRAIVTVLAVGLPLALVQAVRGRNPVPVTESLSAAAFGGEPLGGRPLRFGLRTLSGVRFEQRVYVDPAGALAVEVLLEPASAAPDALLYWVEPGVSPGEGLPEHALLLGRIAGPWQPRFALPSTAPDGGILIVYSLAHQRMVIADALAGTPQ